MRSSWVERPGRASQPSTDLCQSVLISLLAVTQVTHCMVILFFCNQQAFSITKPSRDAAPETAVLVSSLKDALRLKRTAPIHRAFIIGGASLYKATLEPSPEALVDRVLVTRILTPVYDCDTLMPEFRAKGKWKQESHQVLVDWVGFDVPNGVQKQKDGTEYEFQLWTRQ